MMGCIGFTPCKSSASRSKSHFIPFAHIWIRNVGDASKPVLRVGFTQNGDNGTIDECIWMALKSSESSWHVASYNQ